MRPSRRLVVSGCILLLTGCIPLHNGPAGSVPAPLPRARTRVPVVGVPKTIDNDVGGTVATV